MGRLYLILSSGGMDVRCRHIPPGRWTAVVMTLASHTSCGNMWEQSWALKRAVFEGKYLTQPS